MSKTLLQIGFWLSFSVSALINIVLAIVIVCGILFPQYHHSPQAHCSYFLGASVICVWFIKFGMCLVV